MDGEQRYWAFLSYSHADRDQANWLHRALETYVLPRRLIGRQTPAGPAPRRLRPMFKDRDDLAADADLRARVHAALARSSSLIVLCSPAAARSAWVEDEIVRFKSLHGEDRVFAVIASGTPNASRQPGRENEECFPPALRFHIDAAGALSGERAELIAADLRPAGDGKRLARLKLVAGILGLDLDEVIQRDAHRRGRRLMALTAASLAGAAVMGALTVAAVVSRNEARAQRAQAEGLVEFMLGDLRKELEPTGRLDVLDKVGAKAMAYYAAQARHGMDDDALGRRARVLHMLGEIRDERGDLDGAFGNFQKAAAITAELLARRPSDGARIYNHAQSVFYVGEIADRRGQEDKAEKQFLEYRRLANLLVARDPRRDDWRMEVSFANSDLGTLLLRSGRPEAAARDFTAALAIISELARKTPNDRDRQMGAAQTYAWLADAEIAQGFLTAAMEDRRSERDIYSGMLARQHGDNAAGQAQVVNGVAVGRIFAMQGRALDALAELTLATRRSETLMALEPDNTDYRAQATFAYAALARLLLGRNALDAAARAAGRDRALADGLIRTNPSVAIWRGAVVGDARLIQIRIARARASDRAARIAALAPAVEESERLAGLAKGQPNNVALVRLVAEAALLAGDYQSLLGRTDLAKAKWLEAIMVIEHSGLGKAAVGDPIRGLRDRARERLGTATAPVAIAPLRAVSTHSPHSIPADS